MLPCTVLDRGCCVAAGCMRREWVVLGGTGQVGNGSTDMSLADAQKIADRAIQVRGWACGWVWACAE